MTSSSDNVARRYFEALAAGGVKRIVLGHADAAHRGVAPLLAGPVYCQPADRAAAESPATFRPYWDLFKLGPHGRMLLGRLLPMSGPAPAIRSGAT